MGSETEPVKPRGSRGNAVSNLFDLMDEAARTLFGAGLHAFARVWLA